MEHIFEQRKQHTDQRINEFRLSLDAFLGDDRDKVVGDHTCIYATGSAGRGELGAHSDLDVFLLRSSGSSKKLDEVILQSAVVRAMRSCQFPDPSNDGEFLKLHTVEEFKQQMGGRGDDWFNTFTARTLLLLESTPVLGDVAYQKAIDGVLEAYWKNSEMHPRDYLPIVLVNDIVRYWRIVLLNYESKNVHSKDKPEADRWLRSYKLRFSRCLTCYSALAHLLFLSREPQKHVERNEVYGMVLLSPRGRLEEISKKSGVLTIRDRVSSLLDLYSLFLNTTGEEKESLLEQFSNEEFRRARFDEANQFGQSMFELIQCLGASSPLYRFVVV